jgi:hypothetical protein
MKNLLVVLLVFLLFGCAAPKAVSNELESPTYQIATATPLSKWEDVVLEMNEKSFMTNITKVLGQVSSRTSEIGFTLNQCDLAISNGPDSLHGVSITGYRKCVIALIRERDYAIPGLWNDYAPKNGNFLVAATTTPNGNEYPFIVIPEGSYNSEYYVRVLTHEGFHLMRIIKGEDCQDSSDLACFLNEEVLAYQIQFALLENYLKKQDLFDGYKYASPESYSPNGISEQNIRALEMEHELYFQNKDGKLQEFLSEIGYGK